MTAALAVAEALGLNPLVCAERLPDIEGTMVRRLNERIAEHDKPGFSA